MATRLIQKRLPVLLIVRFRNQLIALPQVFCGPALYGFTGSAVKRIIGVGGYLPVRIGPLYQPVPTVIGKGGHQFVGFAAPLYRQVTKAIVLEVPVTKKRQPVARGAVPSPCLLTRLPAASYRKPSPATLCRSTF